MSGATPTNQPEELAQWISSGQSLAAMLWFTIATAPPLAPSADAQQIGEYQYVQNGSISATGARERRYTTESLIYASLGLDLHNGGETMKRFFLAAVLAAAVMVPRLASASTLVSTIDGFYGGTFYDTPWLTISNTTAYDFTNVQITLTGYQGLNNGVVSPTANLANILAGTTQTDVWGSIPGVSGSLAPGNLFANDYDDEYGSNSNTGNSACTINDTQYGVPQYYYCADTGNFYVTLTATWNNPAYGPSGTPIYSQFSPGEDPFGIGNACGNTAGCYIGWLGLDPNGWSETVNDDHSSGGPNGVLANIYVGNPPPVGGVPEPATMLLCGTALGLLGVLRRKRA